MLVMKNAISVLFLCRHLHSWSSSYVCRYGGCGPCDCELVIDVMAIIMVMMIVIVLMTMITMMTTMMTMVMMIIMIMAMVRYGCSCNYRNCYCLDNHYSLDDSSNCENVELVLIFINFHSR